MSTVPIREPAPFVMPPGHRLGFRGLDVVCTCGEAFGSAQRAAVKHLSGLALDAIRQLKRERLAEKRAAFLSVRLEPLRKGGMTAVALAQAWGVTTGWARRYLLTLEARGHVEAGVRSRTGRTWTLRA